MESLFNTLPALLKRLPDIPEVRRAVVFAAWRRTAGEELRERAKPLSVESRRLRVAVPDKNWQRQLESLAPQLLFKLNTLLEDSVIDYIEFVIDPAAFEPRDNAATTDSPGVEHSAEIDTAASAIRDPELRKAVVDAAAESLAYRDRYGR